MKVATGPMVWICAVIGILIAGGKASEGSGIHMHVNRNFFKNELCIARMIRFIENHHGRTLTRTARGRRKRNRTPAFSETYVLISSNRLADFSSAGSTKMF